MKLKNLLEAEGSQFDSLKSFLNDVVFVIDQSKVSHWNLRSKNFVSVHAFFGELYDAMIVHADSIAEQIRILDIDEMVSVNHREPTVTPDEEENFELLADAIQLAIESGELASDGYDDATKNVVDGIVSDLGKWRWKVLASSDTGEIVSMGGEELEESHEADVLRSLKSKLRGDFTYWTFEGDYEILVIGFKSEADAKSAYNDNVVEFGKVGNTVLDGDTISVKLKDEVWEESVSSEYIAKNIYSEDGKKVGGSRSGKFVLGAEDSDGNITNMTWKQWKNVDAPSKVSDYVEKQVIQILLKQIKRFNTKVEFNSYQRGKGFEDKVDWLLTKGGTKFPKTGLNA